MQNWVIKDHCSRMKLAFEQQGYNPVLSLLLSQRGATLENVEDFINPTLRKCMPPPEHLLDLDKFVSRFIEAFNRSETIGFLGDYDVDGATSTSFWIIYCRYLGIKTEFFIPDREKDGYGPNNRAFDFFKSKKINLVITLDCGILAFEPILYANSIGIEVMILDHHGASPELPKASASVNPNRLDQDNTPLRYVAAVGLSFYAAAAVNSNLRNLNVKEPPINSLLDLVALGTVCDVVPMVPLNRAMVKHGINIIKTNPNKGIKNLLDLASLKSEINSSTLGFIIGPRINAGGRVGDSNLGTMLLTEYTESTRLDIAKRLHDLNEERKYIQDRAIEEAKVNESDSVIVLAGKWHIGIIGIMAGRLKDKYLRPTIIFAESGGVLKGSARSIQGFHIGNLIRDACSLKLLEYGGGHPMAGGCTALPSNIDAFREFAIQEFNKLPEELKIPALMIDSELSVSALNKETYNAITTLEPFGSQNPNPIFVINNITVVDRKVFKDAHMRIMISDGYSTKNLMIFHCFQKTWINHILSDNRISIVVSYIDANTAIVENACSL
jgi:single-stranded-DNA-specific exonuclease